MIRFWSGREATPEIQDLGLAARSITTGIIEREARSRRALVLFALVLSLALGAVLFVLGSAGGLGA